MSVRQLREPHLYWAAHKPRRGDLVLYRGEVAGTVASVDGEICHVTRLEPNAEPTLFIWCFREMLNIFHDWPSKHPELIQESADGHGPDAIRLAGHIGVVRE